MKLKDLFKRKEKRNIQNISTHSINYYDKTTINTTVIACKNMIINPISTLPLKLYYRNKDGSKADGYKHPLYNLVKYKPNPDENWSVFVSRMLDHLIENGNAFIYRVYDVDKIIALYLLNPADVIIEYVGMTKSYLYNGTRYTYRDIVQISGKYPDRRGGKSLPDLARGSIILSNRLDDYSKYFFENMISGGRLKVNVDEYIKKYGLQESTNDIQKAIETISTFYRNNYTGEENAGKMLVELPGAKVDQLETASNQEAQLTQQQDRSEKVITKVFDIPWDIYSGENKYNSLEGRNEYFKASTLAFWTNRIEEGLNDLFNVYERNVYFFEFDYNGFLRTNAVQRWEIYKQGQSTGAYTINDILKLENRPSIDADIGDVRFIPQGNIPLTKENIGAYFAQSKLALEKVGVHNSAGDDKS